MADKTVAFRPFDRSFVITGSDLDAGVVGELDRSGGRYQHDVAVFLRRCLAPDAVVVDGGAHVGVLTVLAASLCPEGRVFAFEPAPDSHAHLVANLAANGATNATAEACALYDRDGEVTLDVSVAYPAGAHVAESGGAAVPAVRLDTWASGRGLTRLDLVKLDVEGAELAALAGAEQTIRRLRPVVVVECNPVALRRFGGASYRDLLNRMRSLFSTVGVVTAGGRVTPVLSLEHLELLLGDRGVVDLVGLPARPAPVQRGRGLVRALWAVRRLRRAHNWRRPPERDLLVEPDVRLTAHVPTVTGAPGETRLVPVGVFNAGRWWLSSAYRYQPVHLAYRIFDETGKAVVPEGHRTPFPEPLAPGKSVMIEVTVQLPPEAGRYDVVITLVQESFAWFDELDPATTARLTATVT